MKGRELLDQVFDHLSIVEKDYFGICYQDDNNKMVGFEHLLCAFIVLDVMSVYIVEDKLWLMLFISICTKETAKTIEKMYSDRRVILLLQGIKVAGSQW